MKKKMNRRQGQRRVLHLIILCAACLLVDCLPLPEGHRWLPPFLFRKVKRDLAYGSAVVIEKCRQQVYQQPNPAVVAVSPSQPGDAAPVSIKQPDSKPVASPPSNHPSPQAPAAIPNPSPQAPAAIPNPASISQNAKPNAQTGAYKLAFSMEGNNFFDGWDFWDKGDPTHGTVAYQNRQASEAAGLAKIDKGKATIRVDSTTDIAINEGRKSVRLHSKETFKFGQILIFDAAQAPFGCGTWPAVGAGFLL